MKLRRTPKFYGSLLSRYALIILIALVFIPVALPASFLASWLVSRTVFPDSGIHERSVYGNASELTAAWHKEALQLRTASEEQIGRRLGELKNQYPGSFIFRVNHEGRTTIRLPEQTGLPDVWSTEQLVSYMKNHQDGDPFTIVAFIGDNENTQRGFIVLEVPRSLLLRPIGDGSDRFYGVMLGLLVLFFAGISYWFIRGIRRRLLRLSAAMASPSKSGIPLPIQVGKPDEIGLLEETFNDMVEQLDTSRRREQEEERLRKTLISNLSHDLRTPLTVIGSHLYSLKNESLSDHGQASIQLVESKMKDLDHLIDHLLSYNLLTSGKYALSRQHQDVIRLVRESAAAWYPLWEKEGMLPDIDLGESPLNWNVDGQAFRRVLDNLFQNAVRHASSGAYIGLFTEERHGRTALTIKDRGPGLSAGSSSKGAGLGLAIVDLLLREMGLCREAASGPEGTTLWIYPKPERF
ncbi:HAMP domain-containing sensor histidine kinase [Paenibacillus caui]|uniref:HAMP domain-containing sensor histidine kinase n=1 Tax=Paenibacillus caui TaxID=2873927 RepID=UPI001CAA0100|nr:HAMP domain-containing sensor histidine kinase [Paenibacillus caui]